MQDFSLTRDFGRIAWLPTLVTLGLRALAAGVVWTLIILVQGMAAANPVEATLVLLVGFPLTIIVFFVPVGLAAQFLSGLGVPVVGLLTYLAALVIMVGDPLLFILHKLFHILPLRDFRPFNFEYFIWVIKPA